MCIMEVRPGQRSSTIAQAMAHNLSTIERDLDMFKPLLEARGETELLAIIDAGHDAMKVAYEKFLLCFVAEIEREVKSGHDHDHHDHSGERIHQPHIHPVDTAHAALLEGGHTREEYLAAMSAIRGAEKYETR